MKLHQSASRIAHYFHSADFKLTYAIALPVWMYVCFFMSDFWWNRLPQYWHGYGRVSEWISRWVDSVDDRLNVLPHCLHWWNYNFSNWVLNWRLIVKWIKRRRLTWNERAAWWEAKCWSRLDPSSNTFGHRGQGKAPLPLADDDDPAPVAKDWWSPRLGAQWFWRTCIWRPWWVANDWSHPRQ